MSFKGKQILATICARGGSKGVPRKNLRPLAGLPLIAHTILFARQSPLLDGVVVSTEDEEIARVARTHGAEVPFLRPATMADDAAPKMPVIRHATEEMEKLKGTRYDVVVDLDVTAPFRRQEDLEGALRLLLDKNANAVLSATRSAKNPYFNIAEMGPDGWACLSKATAGAFYARQKAPQTFDLNGSLFVFRRESLTKATSAMMDKTLIWVMDDESRDIDREIDFEFMQMVMARNLTAPIPTK